jgi:hypothetical protein
MLHFKVLLRRHWYLFSIDFLFVLAFVFLTNFLECTSHRARFYISCDYLLIFVLSWAFAAYFIWQNIFKFYLSVSDSTINSDASLVPPRLHSLFVVLRLTLFLAIFCYSCFRSHSHLDLFSIRCTILIIVYYSLFK